jgi:hypothetical protein
MKAIPVDNSPSVLIPGDAEMIGRKLENASREGWAEAAQQIAESRDDRLVMGEFGNRADQRLAW